MKIVDSILDFPNKNWGEDRIFTGKNIVGVIDGSSPISVKLFEGYNSQAEWLADNLAKAFEAFNGHYPPLLCSSVTDRLRESPAFLSARLPKEYSPCATFACVQDLGEYVSCFALGDCSVAVLLKSGNVEVITDERISNYSDKTKTIYLQAILKERDPSIRVKKQMMDNRKFMNTKGGFWAVALTDDYWKEFNLKTYKKSDVIACLVFSDGFGRVFDKNILSYKDFFSSKSSLENIVKDLRSFEEGKLRSHERKLLCSPEVKLHDDASAILVNFD